METTDFFFKLPEKLIAQFPSDRRGSSRLLCLDRQSGQRRHSSVADLPNLIDNETLLVFNDSKVRKARLIGRTTAGGAVEALLLEPLASDRWRVIMKRIKRRKPGNKFTFPGDIEAEIEAEEGDLRILRFSRSIDDSYLDTYGHIPLPPYIKRLDSEFDADRYQTVYARVPGSTAAPTAGLHFTNEIMDNLRQLGFGIAYVTLHVGLGTFLPVRSKVVEEHVMHEERYTISPETATLVNDAKKQGRPVLAIGTTSVRTLESAWQGELATGSGSTRIFIYPGYRFKVVNQMLTNFHVPESTLLMLVCAFAGRSTVMAAYEEAIALGYHFFSYGDAMLIK